MDIKKTLKRIFRRPASWFVTQWAKKAYREGVEAAEKRHKASGRIIYVASATFRPDRLKTYDRVQFRTEKRVFGVHARLLTMNTLRRGCYYHTADMQGKNGLTEKDMMIRREAFIRERLKMAGLK